MNRTGGSLSAIVDEIRYVARVISEISRSVSEQAAGVVEINNSFGRLDEMTQRNSALSEDSASAANGLFNAASELGRLAAQFKTGGGDRGDAATTTARRALG